MDTFFITSSVKGDCGVNALDLVNTIAPQNDFWILADQSVDITRITNASRLAGWFLGDEDDNHATVTDNLRNDASNTANIWASAFPGVPTYVGGSRNRFRGAWANAVDMAGMDFYVAACAPHVTNWGAPFHLRGSFDYLSTTRLNQMPWGSWLYSQAFDSGWNADILGIKIIRQPDPAELSIQMMSVVAAGGKGFMAFQSEIDLMGNVPDSWSTLGNLAREIGALRTVYREGDATGMVQVDDSNVLAELIFSPDALVLVLINIDNNGGYSDLSCSLGGNDHWNMNSHTVKNLQFTAPVGWAAASNGSAAFVDAFELQSASIIPIDGQVQTSQDSQGRWQFTFPSLDLGSTAPTVTRTLVFASSMNLRAQVAAALQPWTPPN